MGEEGSGPRVTCDPKRLCSPHHHGNRGLPSTDGGKRRTGAERLLPNHPCNPESQGVSASLSSRSSCRAVTAARRREPQGAPPTTGRRERLYRGGGIRTSASRSRVLAGPHRTQPLATRLPGSASPWQPGGARPTFGSSARAYGPGTPPLPALLGCAAPPWQLGVERCGLARSPG